MKVLAVVDSDSYVKWGAAVLGRMPSGWSRSIVLIRTPVTPSTDQIAAALAGSPFAPEAVPILDLTGFVERLAVERPDVVLLSVRGPVVRVLARTILGDAPAAAASPGSAPSASRPLIVSGLPGISIPATRKALHYRSRADYFLLHSKREVREFAALAETLGYQQSFGLARMPFLPSQVDAPAASGDIVFAAQAKVPDAPADRLRVLGWLAEVALRHPENRVVVKLRATVGEQQTHAEEHPYDVLLDFLGELPPNLVVARGSMGAQLERASALVTVSSTAAIEAAALGVPILVLDDFGVSAEMINTVFLGSGLLGSSDALLERDFRHPDPAWLDDNYFHEPADEDWIAGIEAHAMLAAAGELPARPQRRRIGGRFRHAWDRKQALGRVDRTLSGYLAFVVGAPLRWAWQSLRLRRSETQEPVTANRSPKPNSGSRDLSFLNFRRG